MCAMKTELGRTSTCTAVLPCLMRLSASFGRNERDSLSKLQMKRSRGSIDGYSLGPQRNLASSEHHLFWRSSANKFVPKNLRSGWIFEKSQKYIKGGEEFFCRFPHLQRILLSNSRNVGWEEEEERERKRMAPHAFTDFWDERERRRRKREKFFGNERVHFPTCRRISRGWEKYSHWKKRRKSEKERMKRGWWAFILFQPAASTSLYREGGGRLGRIISNEPSTHPLFAR